MKHHKSFKRRLGNWTPICVALALCVGCQPASSSADGQVRAAMKVLGMQYGQYLAEHGGTPPADPQKLRDFLARRLDELKVYNVASPDDLLRTGRDGLPLEIVVGAKISSPRQPDCVWAAYEKQGVDGIRLASSTRGGVYALNETEFNEQIPVKNYKN